VETEFNVISPQILSRPYHISSYQRIYFRNMRDDGGVRATMNRMADLQTATRKDGGDPSAGDGTGFKPDLMYVQPVDEHLWSNLHHRLPLSSQEIPHLRW